MIKYAILALFSASLITTTACAEEQNSKRAGQNTVQNVTQTTAPQQMPNTTAADWRDLDPENTLYIKTDYGTFVVELAPEFAPKHVAQIKTLAREKFYDNITFHRVIDGFMNQTGDPRGDGTGDSQMPDIEAEFIFKRPPSMKMTVLGKELFPTGEADTGFYKAFPIGSQSSAMAMLTKDGKVNSWGVHCPNVTSMARSAEVNSANSQFFLMRGEARQLNQKYTVWGTVVWGRAGLTKIKVGTKGDDPNFVPDRMISVRVAADVTAAERINVQVLRTDGRAFSAYIDTLKSDTGAYPKVCEINVPTRLKP